MTSTTAFWSLCLMNLIWGGSYALSKWTLQYLPPATLAFLRFLLAGLMLLPLCKALPKPLSRRDWGLLLLTAFLGITLGFLAHFYGMRLSTATKASIITALEPIILMLLSIIFLGERLTWQLPLALFISTAGTMMLVVGGKSADQLYQEFFGKGEFFGDSLLILSVCLGAWYTILNKSLSESYGSIRITALECLWGALFLLPFALLENTPSSMVSFSPGILASVIFLGVVCTAIGYTLWNQALIVITPSQMAITLNIQPLAGVTVGFFLMGETVTSAILGGAALILLGISLTPKPDRLGLS